MTDPALSPDQQAAVDVALAAEDVRREGLAVSTLKQRETTLTRERDYLQTAAADMRRELEAVPDLRAARERLASLRAERDALRRGDA